MIRGLLCLPNDSKNKVRDYHVEQRARWHSMAWYGMAWERGRAEIKGSITSSLHLILTPYSD